MWLTKSSKNNFFAAHAKGNRQHDDVQNWCLCLKEWGNCLLYTVTCYVLVSSHYFFQRNVLYPFLHNFEFIFDICALSVASMWLGGHPLEEKLGQHV